MKTEPDRNVAVAEAAKAFESDSGRNARRVPLLAFPLAAAAAFALLTAVTLRADITAQVPTSRTSDVSVRISTPVTVLPEFGFLPVRVSVENGSMRDGTWQVRFLAGNTAASTGAISSRLELSVAARQRGDAWYFVPLPDAAPSFTLEPVPAARRAVPIRPRQVTMAFVEDSPTVAGLESRVRSKWRMPPGVRAPSATVQWAGRIISGDRPGEKIGIVTASIPIGYNETPLTGDLLPLGFDVYDDLDATMGSVRRIMYKETIFDPAVGVAPKSSAWASLSSSLTAESTARRALESTGLLSLAEGVTQTVTVTPLESGSPEDPVAWLTTFSQTGSSRLLPLSAGQPLPPGTIVNLHGAGREGEVIRTVSFVEPSALLALDRDAADATPEQAEAYAAAETRAILLRYGFLQPREGIEISRTFPGNPDFAGTAQHEGATLWFEYGPTRLLPHPLFGSLPPDTSVYLRPGPEPDTVVRCFAVGPGARTSVASAAAGKAADVHSELRMTVTGPGIVGASEVGFDGLLPGDSNLALPLAASAGLAPKLERVLLNGRLRGTPNVTPLEIQALPADWRIWSPYHAVLMRETEFGRLSTAQHEALQTWVLQGGLLYIEPTVYDDSGLGPLVPRVPLEVERAGMGRITRLPFSMDDYIAPEDVNLDGSSWIKPAQPSDLIALMLLNTPAYTLPQGEFLHPADLPADGESGGSTANGKWAALLIAGFAILAGPANIFIFAPHGRRHRLFFTVPLLTLAFAGALFACMIIWDGYGGTGNRAVVVVSLPAEHRAVVYQDQVARTGTLGPRRYDVDGGVLMANLSVDDYDSTGRSSLLERSESWAGGDWFRSHWAGAQHLRTLEAMTGEVQVTQARFGSAPTAQSTLPTTLRDFVYMDQYGEPWHATELRQGETVTLERATDVRRWPPDLPGGSQYLEKVFTAAARQEPGRWVAHADVSAIAPIRTLKSVGWQDDIIYTGLVGEGDPVELPPLSAPPPISSNSPG